MDTPTMQSGQTVTNTKSNVPMIVAIIALVAIAIWFLAKPKMDTQSPQTVAPADETTVVQEQATQNFSSSDDTTSLEADLNSSMGDLK